MHVYPTPFIITPTTTRFVKSRLAASGAGIAFTFPIWPAAVTAVISSPVTLAAWPGGTIRLCRSIRLTRRRPTVRAIGLGIVLRTASWRALAPRTTFMPTPWSPDLNHDRLDRLLNDSLSRRVRLNLTIVRCRRCFILWWFRVRRDTRVVRHGRLNRNDRWIVSLTTGDLCSRLAILRRCCRHGLFGRHLLVDGSLSIAIRTGRDRFRLNRG